MLFNYTIKNWDDWGKVFQLIENFTPLAQEIFRREKLEFANLENLTPGTNAVFRAGNYVVKIFAPKESGLDSQADYLNESAVCGALTERGIPTPRLVACGSVQDKYLFYYIITEYYLGVKAGTWLEKATPNQQEVFIERLRELLQKLNRPAHGLIPPVDLLARALENPRLERLPETLRAEMTERARMVDLRDTVLIHGDLTGENILVDEGGSPIIIDCADACLAPWWYELAPLVFELFHCQRNLLRMFVDTAPKVFVGRVLDAVCIHDFGANMLLDLAEREKVPCFSHLAEVRDFLLSRVCG
ncbi:MAG: aminoglycoside phosphotransferase family protein [Acutalibacter muris]|jgi:aminoglycoside phosphotransferase (APT) family kinase protein|nr:aminoglycoside phosphotransferase family protein [Acutalibacter muris]